MVLPEGTHSGPPATQLPEFSEPVKSGVLFVPYGGARISSDLRPLLCEHFKDGGYGLLLRNTNSNESLFAHLPRRDGFTPDSRPVIRTFVGHFLAEQGLGTDEALLEDIKAVTKYGHPHLKFDSRKVMRAQMEKINNGGILTGSFIFPLEEDRSSWSKDERDILATFGIRMFEPIVVGTERMAALYRPRERRLYIRTNEEIMWYQVQQEQKEK